ncbi:hypothetical protein P3T21_003465 [Paraburkholderia sp. GAS334]
MAARKGVLQERVRIMPDYTGAARRAGAKRPRGAPSQRHRWK